MEKFTYRIQPGAWNRQKGIIYKSFKAVTLMKRNLAYGIAMERIFKNPDIANKGKI